MRKIITIFCFCVSAYSDSSKLRTKADVQEIRDVEKRNATFRKLAAEARVAEAKRDAFSKAWLAECESKGMTLSVVVPGDGRLDCIAKPAPAPPAKETK